MRDLLSILIVIAVFVGPFPAYCQTSPPTPALAEHGPSQRELDFETSKRIAVEIYPDAINDGSQLVTLITKMDMANGQNGSSLYQSPFKPLIVAAQAAQRLNIKPHWDTLTDADKNEVMREMAAAAVLSSSVGTMSAPGIPSQASTQAQPWKVGDALGTITTTIGKTYADAKLTAVSPSGITILVADGGATIPFDALSPELQQRFGYDPQKAAIYGQQQYYEQRIAGLEAQVSQLQQSRQVNGAARQPGPQAAPRPSPTVAGYRFFLDNLKNQSGPKANGKFRQGPLAGLTEAQAEPYAQQQWSSMSYDDQMAYERQAKTFGESPAQAAARAAAQQQQSPPQQGTHIYQVIPQPGGGSTIIGN